MKMAVVGGVTEVGDSMTKRLTETLMVALLLVGCADGGDPSPRESTAEVTVGTEPTPTWTEPPSWDEGLLEASETLDEGLEQLNDAGCSSASVTPDECAEPLEQFADVLQGVINDIEAVSDAHGNEPPESLSDEYQAITQAISSAKAVITSRDAVLGEVGCSGAVGISQRCAEPLGDYTDVVLDAIRDIDTLSDAHGNEPPAEKIEHYNEIRQAISAVETAVAERESECTADESSMRCANARIRALNRGSALRWALQDWYAPIGGP